MTAPAPRTPIRLRRNFGWALLGTTTYNLSQWLLVVVLARLGSPEMVGQFALAQAIAAPVFLTAGLNLRIVRATDVQHTWSAGQYVRLRALLNLLALTLTFVVGLWVGLGQTGYLVLVMVALGKASEATSQMLYGYFQQREQLRLVSRSLLLRSVLGSMFFVVAFVVWHDVVAACAALALGWLTTYLLHDRPEHRALLRVDPAAQGTTSASTVDLARRAFPLGLDAGVSSLAINAPRYGVHQVLGTAALGLFVPLVYLGQLVTMVTGSLAQAMIARLARAAATGNAPAFRRDLLLLTGFSVGLSVAGVMVGWVAGEAVIRVVLGPEYVNQGALMLILAGSGVTTLLWCLERGLQGAHRFRAILAVDAVCLVAVVCAGLLLIPAFGVLGAAATLACGNLVGVLIAGWLLASTVQSMRSA